MNAFWSAYSPRCVVIFVYMLQSSEYAVSEYFAWLYRTRDFSKVMKRRRLTLTAKATGLVAAGFVLYAAVLGVAIWLVFMGGAKLVLAALVLVTLPYIVAHALPLPLVLGQILIQKPQENRLIQAAGDALKKQHCRKIAIAGSFGKTTFKETLQVVLSEKLHVAASPGNMNTPLGLANFIQKLDGSEDVLIFELGEERVGDVKRLCDLTRPNMGVITGISEAHLDTFGSVEAIVQTVFELSEYLKSYDVYKNGDSELVVEHVSPHDQHVYTEAGVNGWKVSDVVVRLDGTSFVASKKGKTVWADSRLLGRHQVGPLVACIDIADKLGLSVTEIAEGIKRTEPFEHRMQPRMLYGATIIDDTYNGNRKGIEAGLEFLRTVDATRKIFVTPGLVGQGDQTEPIHEHIGELAADVADVVVLMNNSTTAAIKRGLKKAHFSGGIQVIDDPLEFYTNLDVFVAAGDVVLMQNDWTDNYA